jgi:hypothetical protein
MNRELGARKKAIQPPQSMEYSRIRRSLGCKPLVTACMASINGGYMESFATSIKSVEAHFNPQHLLQKLCPGVCGLLRADRIGIAYSINGPDSFQNVALWDRLDQSMVQGSHFTSKNTAAAWVRDFSYPVFGSNLDQMKRYPSTLAYLHREKFISNLLLPLVLGNGSTAVLYALSRTSGTYNETIIPFGIRIQKIVEPAMTAFYATRELIEGCEYKEDCLPDMKTESEENFQQPTLEQIQKLHIVDTLAMTNGVIDGPKGAAKILDIHPSTLRNRMRKLGI